MLENIESLAGVGGPHPLEYVFDLLHVLLNLLGCAGILCRAGWTNWVCTPGESLPVYTPHAPGFCTKRTPGT
jgi:hypothetical protein